jgi:hypothetical protein
MGREGYMIHLWGQDNKVNFIEVGIFNMVLVKGPIAYQH